MVFEEVHFNVLFDQSLNAHVARGKVLEPNRLDAGHCKKIKIKTLVMSFLTIPISICSPTATKENMGKKFGKEKITTL